MNTFHDALVRRLAVINSTGTQATQQTQNLVNSRMQAKMKSAHQANTGGGLTAPSGKWKPGTLEALIAFGKQAQSMGYRVAENPHFGNGRVGKHSKNSRHYSGRAVDINWAAGTSKKEQDMLRRLIPLSQQYGLRNIFMQPGHYGHAHFDF